MTKETKHGRCGEIISWVITLASTFNHLYFYKNLTRAQRSPYEAREETRVEETVSEDWSSEAVSQVILKPPDS